MRILLIRIFAWLLIFSLSSFTYGWNALGHMVIGTIAYQKLQPNIKTKVDNLISYFHNEYPNMATFSQMAYWPDAIRSQRIETFTHWHYIDVAFSKDGTPLKNVMDTDNAVWAINIIENIVRNNQANTYERARFLAFLAHIVGDLHQPLHTVSYFSAAHPDGDRGGNAYVIRYQNGDSNTINMHKLWDGGIGVFDLEATSDNATVLANSITQHYPVSYFGARATVLDPNIWTQEGMDNAEHMVYTTPENQTPSTEYLTGSSQLAQQEAALAGYRLAVLLNQLLA